jgi:hypothetical protein
MLWFLPGAAAMVGLLADFISGGIASLVGLTGLCAGAAHYGSVLAGLPKRKVEWMTGVGFFSGAVVGLVVMLVNAVV